jgi:cytochrome c
MQKQLIAIAAMVAAASLAAPAWAAGDAAAGAVTFKAKCGLCHSVVAGKNGVGPSLFGVVGRGAGSAPGYSYSAANKASGKTWDEASLDTYLTNPKAFVPGTKMVFPGLANAADRGNVIAYLATNK